MAVLLQPSKTEASAEPGGYVGRRPVRPHLRLPKIAMYSRFTFSSAGTR